MSLQRISLVIPAYNEEKYLGNCLKSVLAHSQEFHEIIVINNASTDKTAEVARSFPGVRVIHEPEKGITHARQRGCAEASGDIIAYIDADTVISEHWPPGISNAFGNIPDLVCLSGPCIYYDFPPFRQFLTRLYWRFLAQPASWFTGYLAIGGNLVVKKEALEKIGGFNRAINFYGEDTDVAKRLSKVGKVVFRQDFYLHTSARRLHHEGFLKIAWRYTLNFLSVVFTHRVFTKKYQDIR
jgi:glycosyltransferase involved in cell wall biosynthesis